MQELSQASLHILSRIYISDEPALPLPSLDDTPSEPLTTRRVHEYRAMVKDKLHNAMESTIYMCGMAALAHDDPCYDMFQCDPFWSVILTWSRTSTFQEFSRSG